MTVQPSAVCHIEGPVFSGKKDAAVAVGAVIKLCSHFFPAKLIQHRILFQGDSLYHIIGRNTAVAQAQHPVVHKNYHFRLFRQRKKLLQFSFFPVCHKNPAPYTERDAFRFRFGEHLAHIIAVLHVCRDFRHIPIHADSDN